MWSRCGTTVSARPISSRCCGNSKRPSCSPSTASIRRIADVTGDFVYARLQKGNDDIKTCYPPKELDAWAKRLELWAGGGEPDDLPRVEPAKVKKAPRDVFAYVIHEGKVRAPAGAMELIERVS